MSNELQTARVVNEDIEFCVDGGYVTNLPKAIETNFEAVKQYLIERTEPDRNLVVTTDNIASAKARCALLNKQIDSIEGQRKEVKKLWNTPYANFEKQCKELTATLTEAREKVWKQVLEIENEYNIRKLDEYRDYFENNGADILTVRNFDQIQNPKWLNKGYDKEKVLAEINDIITTTRADVQAILSLGEMNTYALLLEYSLGNSLAEVIKLNTRIKDLQNAYKQEQIHETPKAAEKPKIEPQDEERTKLGFWAEATITQFKKLKDFFTENGINYGQLPVEE